LELVQKEEIDVRDPEDFQSRLSPSAFALLRVVREFEANEHSDIFQPDPELNRVRVYVNTYRGSIYSALVRRLEHVLSLGGVEAITQPDIFSLIQNLWDANVSRPSPTEHKVLEGVTSNPELGLTQLSSKIGLSYAQTRRATSRLRESGLLRMEGILNVGLLALDRILVILKDPDMILNSPYLTKSLFVDGSSREVFLQGLVPSEKRKDLLNMIKSLRAVASSATIWHLSEGRSQYSNTYFDTQNGGWNLDLFHVKLLLRAGGGDLTMGDITPKKPVLPEEFTHAELRLIDSLCEKHDSTVAELIQATGLSESTAFRKRQSLQARRVVVPRTKIRIPVLSDRLITTIGPDTAGNLMPTFGRLPLTYYTRIQNLEKPSERRILITAALPAGSAQPLIEVLNDEKSRADDYTCSAVSAGTDQRLKVNSMFNRRKKKWKFDSSFFDLRGYGIARREATSDAIPLDLA
jgi:hypothetical protein